jgi:hypothetical protein
MSRDIYKVACQYLWKKKSDDYRIYNPIISTIARIIANVKCEEFKMSKVSHVTMFLPSFLTNNPICHILVVILRVP